MNFLAIVQDIHVEAKLPGNPPGAVAGQVGRAADLVRWGSQAYVDIQLERAGRWKWMLGDFSADLLTSPIVSTQAFDVQRGVAVDGFRAWELDRRNPWFIFKVSETVATQRELLIADWNYFRKHYLKGSPPAGYPYCVAIDAHGKLYFAPAPDTHYTINGHFWRNAQRLAADDDEPEMPENFHKLIVYQAIKKYGYDQVAQEILSRVTDEGARMYDSLVDDQSYSRFSFTTAGALA